MRKAKPTPEEVGQAIRDKVQEASDFTDQALLNSATAEPRGIPVQAGGTSAWNSTWQEVPGVVELTLRLLTNQDKAAEFLAQVLPSDQPANLKLFAEIVRQLAGIRDTLEVLASAARPIVSVSSMGLTPGKAQVQLG